MKYSDFKTNLIKLFHILVLLSPFYNCIGQRDIEYKILNDVICDVLGVDYNYESYTKYFSDTLHSGESYESYIENRKELDDSNKVIFINNYFESPEDDSNDFFRYVKNDSILKNDMYYKNLLNKFLNQITLKKELNIQRLKGNCNYIFLYFDDTQFYDLRASEISSFFISPIVLSDDKKSACFYFAGGRGDYFDLFIIVERKRNTWMIIKKMPVGVY